MILISGLSGAGKSTALHALEDAGFFCTDNLPVDMLPAWVSQMRQRAQPAAVCIDARSCARPEDLRRAIESVLATDGDWRLLFLDASDTALQRRFSSVKRRHPYAPEQDLMHAIALERAALSPLQDMADLVLDSSSLNPYELSERVEFFWRQQTDIQRTLRCTVMSFSYRQGVPQDADMVIDVRFLPNPHYQPELAPLTGLDQPVIDFFADYTEVEEIEQWVLGWLQLALPKMLRERKQYFTLAFGCSGGRHRSVYLAERTARWLRDNRWTDPAIRHRELNLFVEGGSQGKWGEES